MSWTFILIVFFLFFADSNEIVNGMRSKESLDKIAAILRTVTSNLDIK